MILIGINASSAVAGSIVGAFASVVSSFVMQRGATHRDFLGRTAAERLTLYSKFIRDAARVYAKALVTSNGEIEDIVRLYSLVSRMRLLASPPVVKSAEDAIRAILGRYSDPNLTLEQLQASARQPVDDPLEGFSIACRTELSRSMDVGGRKKRSQL